MSEQATLDAYRESLTKATRREGERRALGAEPRGWADAAWSSISSTPIGAEFTSDDVQDRVGPAPSSGAMAAVIRRAAEARLIVKTGDYTPSRRIRRRGGVIAIWRRTAHPGTRATPP